jgi:heme exporter protein B
MQLTRLNTIAVIGAVIRRDLLLAMRRKSEVLTTLFFFVIVASLFPLGIGPEPALLRRIAPGVLWVGALLACMLSLNRMFAADHADGTLEQMALSPEPLALLVAAKIAAHWLVSGLPLVLIAPVLGLQFDLDARALAVLALSLLLGTPLLSLIGAIGAGLTLGVRGGGVLLSLLTLPLYIPALIFGAGAVEAELSGLGAGGNLSLLAALLVLAAFFAPWATAAALRIALE